MKKTIIFTALMGFFTLSFSQGTIPAISETVGEEVLIKDVPLEEFTLYADSLKRLLDKINSFNDIPGNAKEIIDFYPKIKDGMVTFIKQVKKPDSLDEVPSLVKLISDYAGVIGPMLLWFITLLYRLFKQNTAHLLAVSGKVFNFMRTRYFIAILTGLITLAWVFFFKGDASFWEIISFLFGTAFKGIGFAMVLGWVKDLVLKILGKKEVVKA